MTKEIKRIYLDYAATTPVDNDVLKEMEPYFNKYFGNPSSIHNFGQQAKTAIEEARENIANILNCSSPEIIFTGSATEANNLAIFGIVKSAIKRGNKSPHIITSQIEHPSILSVFKELEKQGIKTTYIPVDNQGIIMIDSLKKAITPNTVLVSIMYANNEIGTIQPIQEISNIIKQLGNKTYFHTDAVQAINYLNCDVQELGIDLLTLSGHKIYGPKGIGVLYVRKECPIEPLILGGHQENNMRSGTENTANIVGLSNALEKTRQNLSDKIKKTERLRNMLIDGIINTIPGAKLNGSKNVRLPNNANISIPKIEGESMVIALDQEGIAVSTGSACSSQSLKPSHVLLALGLSPEQAHGSLRFSLGNLTTEEEIKQVLIILPKVVERLRRISPFK